MKRMIVLVPMLAILLAGACVPSPEQMAAPTA